MSIRLPNPFPRPPETPPVLLLINPTSGPNQFSIQLAAGTTLLDSAGQPAIGPITVKHQETNIFTIVGSPTGISSPPIPDNTFWMIY